MCETAVSTETQTGHLNVTAALDHCMNNWTLKISDGRSIIPNTLAQLLIVSLPICLSRGFRVKIFWTERRALKRKEEWYFRPVRRLPSSVRQTSWVRRRRRRRSPSPGDSRDECAGWCAWSRCTHRSHRAPHTTPPARSTRSVPPVASSTCSAPLALLAPSNFGPNNGRFHQFAFRTTWISNFPGRKLPMSRSAPFELWPLLNFVKAKPSP